MIIHIYVIAPDINHRRMKKFEDFNTFLASNDWFMLLKNVKEKYLASQKVTSLYQKEDKKSIAKIVRCLLICKYKYKINYIDI